MSDQTAARIGGWAGVVGGSLGGLAAVLLLTVPPAVSPDRFSYPLEGGTYVAVQVIFCLHHFVIAVALLGFWRAGLAGRGRFATTAACLSVGTMLLLAAQELVSIAGVDAPLISPLTDAISAGYGVITIVLGIGLVLLGIAAARARILVGIGRWAMFITGAYVFFPLLPAIFAPFAVGRVALGVWLLLFAWTGLVMLRWAGSSASPVEATRDVTAGTPS